MQKKSDFKNYSCKDGCNIHEDSYKKAYQESFGLCHILSFLPWSKYIDREYRNMYTAPLKLYFYYIIFMLFFSKVRSEVTTPSMKVACPSMKAVMKNYDFL